MLAKCAISVRYIKLFMAKVPRTLEIATSMWIHGRNFNMTEEHSSSLNERHDFTFHGTMRQPLPHVIIS